MWDSPSEVVYLWDMKTHDSLITETRFFESKLPELVKSDAGRFVLIKGEEIKGVFIAQQDAIKAGYQLFRKEAFLVKQIIAVQQPLNFANNCFQA